MLKRPRVTEIIMVAVLLLLSVLSAPAWAVPVRVHGGRVIQLNNQQVELLKRQPGVYYLKTSPEKLFKDYVLLELPDELGGGFLLSKPADMATALEEVGAIGRAQSTRMAATAPSKETWFAELYLGGLCRKTAMLMGKHFHSV